uniref:Tripartite motif containing 69 n=1 Tax=Pseudonaja textilis TaxID=8673 RepID=A0A670YY34_PSETE
MSSVQEVSSFTEDLLCPICLSLFREPHILECGHSFCAPCLEPCIPKGESQGLCPECRHPFTLHHVNRALSSLAKKARLLKLDEGTQLSSTGGWYFCEEHGEPLKLFCRQDKESVCVICRDLPQHRGHNFLPIKNAVQAYQVRTTPWRSKKVASEDQREKNLARMETKSFINSWLILHSFVSGFFIGLVYTPAIARCTSPLLFILNSFHLPSPVPASITLESYSAYPSLVFVEENTGIKFSRQRRSVGSFTSTPIPNLYTPYAVGQKGNSTGRFYWEIQVGDSPDWIVGMAQKFEKRKNWLNFLPKEGVWAIRLKAGNYQALSDPRTPLTVCGKMEKVGVYLDFEGGQLSFYNSSSMSHLYTFQSPFYSLFASDRLEIRNLVWPDYCGP